MQKRILCYGDSKTWGAIPNESERYPDDVRSPAVLHHELASTYKLTEGG